jgi:hypothetical protein
MAGLKPTRANDCPVEQSSCGNNGLCNGNGGCQQIPDGTQCGTYCCTQGPATVAAFCHLVCANGSCSGESNMVAGTCQDTNPCSHNVCQTMGTHHVCRAEGGCDGLLGCCCVALGIPPMCTERIACINGLGGVCAPAP